MAYKAKIEIGDYKVGDIVPDEQAIIWDEMYEESPVELVGEILKEPTEETLTEEVEGKVDESFFDKLIAIDGIGKKTAKDIVSEYKTEAELKESIEKEEHIPFRDDVVENLIDIFGK